MLKGNEQRRIALALQGGGAHGAFTWGVIDRILEEPQIDIIGITGTSAGAMNAVVLADGLLRGGPVEARRRLRICSAGIRILRYSAFESRSTSDCTCACGGCLCDFVGCPFGSVKSAATSASA